MQLHLATIGAALIVLNDHRVGGDARIKVIGVGGGGGNAINRMVSSGLQARLTAAVHSQLSAAHQLTPGSVQGVEFWAVNTDAQALEQSLAQNRVQIGSELTRGLGTGGNPSLGEHAAQESAEALSACVNNGDMVSPDRQLLQYVSLSADVCAKACSTSLLSNIAGRTLDQL